MYLLDELDLPVEQQLALDECLLFTAEAATGATEYFRLWELDSPAVILGRGSHWQQEVNVEFCRQAGIPILRRCSGGATVVGGPGCLFYSVVLDMVARPELRVLDKAHCFVLNRINDALTSLGLSTELAGTSDLALVSETGQRKVSGNSVRLRRDHLLYHGTLLYSADLELVAKALKTPPREPQYRAGRSHAQFISNLPVARRRLQEALVTAWSPLEKVTAWPQTKTIELSAEKYETAAWNHRL